jgi:hypothetical protein
MGNTRATVFVSVGGESMPMKRACEKLGVHYQSAHSRMRRLGISAEEAITMKHRRSPSRVLEGRPAATSPTTNDTEGATP